MPLNNAMQSYIIFTVDNYRKNNFPDSDLITYYGSIEHGALELWEKQIGNLVTNRVGIPEELVVILSTHGGSVECVEKMVDISRRFYKKVSFVIPSQAMSAGTIWTMSGDNIYMSYLSSLGPIDPQVQSNDGRWVPALGYLDKFNEIVEKSKNGTVSQVELMMINQLDLANLRRYEQATELSVSLLKKWLTKYKFKDWSHKETTGEIVTESCKLDRARQIAEALSDNNKWLSHSRFINIDTLQSDLNIRIDDYTDNHQMMGETTNLHDLILDFKLKNNYAWIIYIAKRL